MSEKGNYFRAKERENTPRKIWDEYDSGLDKYERTFAGLGSNPIESVLQKRKVTGLKTIMFDVAASGTLINELHRLDLIDSGISFTLVDPRKSILRKVGDYLFNHSLLRIGDIVNPITFFTLPKAQVITFRPVGAFDDYPEDEYVRALSNSLKCLDPNGGTLFAQLPVSNHPSENKGHRIVNNLNLGNQWKANISENSYARQTKRNGYFPENTSMATHSVVMFQRQG